MTNRENLVGTILGLQMVGDTEGDGASGSQGILLIEFMGEGSQAVVFATGSPEDGSPSGEVVKIFKPKPWFEMETLHHSFRVHERLYPEHPLRMSPEERLRRLTAEMTIRIDSGRLVHRVRAYRELFDATLNILAKHYLGLFKEDALTASVLWEDETIRLFVDDNLLNRLQELLDEDAFVAEYEDFFAKIVKLVPAAIVEMKQAGVYRPIATNPIASLAGLYIEDFINYEETMHIASGSAFNERLKTSHLQDSLEFAGVFFNRAIAMVSSGTDEAQNAEKGTRAFLDQCSVAFALFKLTRNCSFGSGDEGSRLAAISRAFEARTRILQGGANPEALDMLVATLDELDRANAFREKHGVLVDLAKLYRESDGQRASRYLAEALHIEERIQDPPANMEVTKPSRR